MNSKINQYCRDNHRDLCKKAYRWLKDHHHAEDAVQEAYFRAIKYQKTFREGADFEVWFTRIFYNSVKSVQAEVRNGGVVLEVKPQQFLVEVFDDEALKRFNLKEEILSYDGDEDSKEKLTLHFVLGYRAPEVAEFMGVTVVNVYSTVARFKKQMKDKYKPRG